MKSLYYLLLKVKRYIILSMFFTILLSSSLFVAEPKALPDHPATLDELVDVALSNNPETKIAWWNAKRAASSVDASKSAYYPKLDLNMGAAHGKDYEFINGPNKKYTQTNADLVLSMILFDFGARSSEVEACKKALEAANWRSDFSLQKVMIQVLERSYELLHAQEVVEASRITRDDAKKMLHVAEELQRIGHTSISDVYSSRATLGECEMRLAEDLSSRDKKRARLLQLLGCSVETTLTLAPLTPTTSFKSEDIATLIQRAKENRKDLLAKAADLAEAHANLEKSNAFGMPELSMQAKGGFEHYHHDGTKSGNYDLRLNLKIPLFSGFETIYKNRMAYADTKTSLGELASLELQIAEEVYEADRTHSASQEMLGLASSYLENSRLAYEAALEKYKAGKEEMFEATSNALQKLALARVRYSEIKTEWLMSLAKIAYATGTL